jgi:hypothetical protein
MAVGLREWLHIDENYAVSEFEAQLFGWKKPRRFVVVRELVRDTKEAVGRRLLDVPCYTFRIFVSNRVEDALVLWRDYNRRASIGELKAELNADGFRMKHFLRPRRRFCRCSSTKTSACASQKGIYRKDSTVILTVVEVLGEKFTGTTCLSGRNDHGIPQRELPTRLQCHTQSEKSHGIINDRKQ